MTSDPDPTASHFRLHSSHFPRFIFFGGKGGVGKTTCAAAWALHEAGAGRRVLVVSTDPAHSLGDVLGARLSSRVSEVRIGARTVRAMELDGPRAYRRWLTEHRRALGDALEHGTWLDREDIEALLQLSMPGVDELVALLEIVRVAGGKRAAGAAYDSIVIDTAPTGHALRLLAAPGAVAAVADVLDALQLEHRMIRQQLARVGRPEAADRIIALLAEQAQTTASLLRDRDRTRFHWVLLPETLSVDESENGLRALAGLGVQVSDLVVNQVRSDGPRCPICDRRRHAERQVIARISARLPRRSSLRVVRAELREPRGAAALRRIGTQLVAAPSSKRGRTPFSSDPPGKEVRPLFVNQAKAAPTMSPDAVPDFPAARLLMFAGKGGVGKTTAAAATALRLARAHPDRPVLLISTDPAHSLGHVFGIPLGDQPRTLPRGPANLQAREMDAAAALARRRGDLETALQEIAAAVGSGQSMVGSRATDMIDLAPPGIDELLAIMEVSDHLRLHPEMLVIIDSAPTAHALRLLEMPDVAREWVRMLLRVLLKYRQLVRPGQLAVELLNVSKSIRLLQELLHDGGSTRVVVVTRAAAIPRLETERLIARLGRLGLPPAMVLVNALTPSAGRCTWCRATRAAERRELAALARATKRRSRECAIILAPLGSPPPTGIAALEQWAASWVRLPQRTLREQR